MTDESNKIDDVKAAFDTAEDISPADAPVPDAGGSGAGGKPPQHAPPAAPDDSHDPWVKGATFPLNDTGNGERLAHYIGFDLVHVPRVGWHVWDGRRYLLDPDGLLVRKFAQTIQSEIIKEIPHVTLEDWQWDMINEEPAVLSQFEVLSMRKRDELSAEEKIKLDDLNAKLQWIRKLKDRKSGMKSEHRSFAKTSGNKGRIDAMLTEATTILSRDVEDLDSDPLVINTQSGLLRFTVDDLREYGAGRIARVDLEPHSRQVLIGDQASDQIITKMMATPYDPDAKCPEFLKFLRRVQPDESMQAFLQRWWGLSMTALPVQKFVFQYGKGANGKSVLADLMRQILGDYAAVAKIESITGRNSRGASDAAPDLMLLRGSRCAVANEAEEGQKLQEKTIKDMTSNEPMLARNLFGDFVRFSPLFKLTISGNHKPDIRGTDDGIWRRVLLVPFDVQIPEHERDEKLIDKLLDERAGILNWLIEGLIDYLEGGLQEPKEVLEATQDYRADSDPIGTFLAEACVVSGNSDDFLSAREMIDGFNLWLDQRGEGMWGQRTVSLKVKAEAGRYHDPNTGRAFAKAKRDVTGYRGIKFTDEFRKAYDQAPRNNQGRPVAFGSSKGSNDDGGDFHT